MQKKKKKLQNLTRYTFAISQHAIAREQLNGSSSNLVQEGFTKIYGRLPVLVKIMY